MHDDLGEYMETALFISTIDQFKSCFLGDYQFAFADSKSNHVDAAYNRMCSFVQENNIIKFSHLYFGVEFCEYLIPSVESLARFADICMGNDLFPVFVTPVVTDYGIDRLEKCFAYLNNQLTHYGVVVNDIGVLHMIQSCSRTIDIIAGRVLDKTSHDCRIPEAELANYYSSAGMRYASEPGVLSEEHINVLSKLGVCRYEFDLPITGLRLRNTSAHYSLYWPFQYITTGRVCLFRALTKTGKNRFLVGSDQCSQPCRGFELELRKPLNGYSFEFGIRKNNNYLYQKGNTLYYTYDNPNIAQQLAQFDRIIFQIL